ncbi:hypothetical protein GUJ93_ZPchr0013g34042 [Zizania palustris]|uniref:mRNA-decapping enzyme-like protein n=1 Tax=Zizania palustris TaxID=103762 RepID=A0A8J5X018_ZIZPA|nr:hypothetical protein GUJ93_ZPchr0013g34042 [Zizania palustris]
MARGGSGGGDCGWRRLSKVTPNLVADKEGTRMLNLTVLRRLDPAVADIVITAAHVVLYSFDILTSQWSRKAVEGSLFVVKRNTQPRFQFVVMNRRNTENHTEDLLGGFEYEVEVPYIMYRNAAEEVIGIWFYDPQECEKVAHVFCRVRNAFSRLPQKADVSATESLFEESEVVPAVSSTEDTLEQSTSTTMAPNNAEYKFLSPLPMAAGCVGATMDESAAIESNKYVGMVPSCTHSSSIAIPSESPDLHGLPSQMSSVPVMPLDAHRSSSASIIQPTSLANPLFFPPMASLQATSRAALSLCAPPLHPPITVQQLQSAPLFQPLSLPSTSHTPPCGMPLLQPFPPPNPFPLLAPAVSYCPVVTRDILKGVMLKLSESDDFIDMIYREILKAQLL